MVFYEELKELRQHKGFTIREVAGKSGVSSAYISQLENGHRGTPSPDILNKLSDGLEVPYTSLMHMAGYIDKSIEQDAAQAKKPVNLRRFLRENAIVLDGRPLTEDDVKWLDRMLTTMFSRDN